MKLLGLIGGMSWESTAVYYKLLNRSFRKKLGGAHSCHCLLHSLDFEPIQILQHKNDLKAQLDILIDSVQKLNNSGVELIIICTNTMHRFYDELQTYSKVPILHITDATALELQKLKLKRPLILGTKFTMELDFYKGRLLDKYGISSLIPGLEDREKIHNIIFEELVKGKINEQSRMALISIINKMKKEGADSVILGCTEIPLLIKQEHIDFPVLDTMKIHVEAAIPLILS